ncbi:orange carotenoid protein N-terminal domain-containing protein [Cronbergia sp. UHCC 0137]|uniref:orange carotenoid protein N-terminal domain-containing protein n=1 Tax=Cronbergia sp. UHCC 0137 TaxID=3110239 RepID=UPI002B211B2C|nr:orange carotenoid protein N-terminal domain-containing protein [Cronbergia sp. UHCC 0137]MEA5620599.1 orange carotenoid protein N-terminal domain-containing protein [Cronbergia sp. UHCC 0137]
MISTNINLLQQSVSEFIKLDIDDKLGLLWLIYQHFSNSITLEKIEAIAQLSI